MRILIAIFALLPLLAHAADVTVSCISPTKYTDGSPIAAGTVIAYTLYGGFTGATKTALDTKPACEFTRTNVAPGTAEYYVTASIANVESDPSGIVTVVIAPKPEPPTLVTISTSAYELRGTANAPTLALTGLAPLGVVCGPETRVINGVTYCRVPKMQIDAVVWPQNLALTDLWVKGAPQ